MLVMSKVEKSPCPYETMEKSLFKLLLMYLHCDVWEERQRFYIDFMRCLRKVSQLHKKMYGLRVYTGKRRVI